jgi:hypothetical protein
MLIKKLHANVFDVFIGVGFNNWTRVRRGHWGVSVIAGNRVPRSVMREIEHSLNG